MTSIQHSNFPSKGTEDLVLALKKETEILTHKLQNENNPVIIDCVITDYLVSIIKQTNKITPFKLSLEMEND